MQITSNTKIVPIVFTNKDSTVFIKAFAPEQKAVVHLYDTEYSKTGDFSLLPVSGQIDCVVINGLDDIELAAKLAFKARPNLSDEFPAAVLRYNQACIHHDVMYWHPVNKFGQFKPYDTSGWFDVPENGAFLFKNCDTDHTRIFYSPVEAITEAYEQTVKLIGDILREAKAEEEKIQKKIEEKKALIDLINKSQEI